MDIIYATDESNGIGKNGKLAWRIPEDMKRFREVTHGRTILMGRKTAESIPKKYFPLKGRKNFILTANPDFEYYHPDVTIFTNINEAFDALIEEEGVLIGGSTLYEYAFLHYADLISKIYKTHIMDDFECDVFLPDSLANIQDSEDFILEDLKIIKSDPECIFYTYVRK